MNIKKSLLIAGAVTSIGAAGITAGSTVAADPADSGHDTLVSKIAQKFNLKQDEVQAVFDEERKNKQAEHQQQEEQKLAQAVKDGKLTEEQKSKIIAKKNELREQREAERDSMKDKSREERKQAMEAKRTELEKWAQENNIPTEYLHHGKGRGGPGGPR